MNTIDVNNIAQELENNYDFLAAITEYEKLVNYYTALEKWEEATTYHVNIVRCYAQMQFFKAEQVPNNAANFIEHTILLAKEKLGQTHFQTLKAQLYQALWYRNNKEETKGIELAENLLVFYQEKEEDDIDHIAEIHFYLLKLISKYEDSEKNIEVLTNAQTFFEKHQPRFLKYLIACFNEWGHFTLANNPLKAIKYLSKANEWLDDKIPEGFEEQVAERYLYLGITYFNLKELDFAITYFRRSLHIALNHFKSYRNIPYLYMNIGNCWLSKMEGEQALYHYQEAEKAGKKQFGEKNMFFGYLYSKWAEYYNFLRLYTPEGVQKQIELNRKAIDIYILNNDPWSEWAITGLAILYANINQYDRAIEIYHQAAREGEKYKKHPKRYESVSLSRHIHLAFCYQKINQFDEALKEVQKALQMCQNNEEDIHELQLLNNNGGKKYIFNCVFALKLKANILSTQYLEDTSYLERLQAAIFSSQVAIQFISQIRKQYGLEDTKFNVGLFEESKDLYYYTITYIWQALAICEENPDLFRKTVDEIFQLNKDQFPPSEFNYLYTKEQLLEYAFYCTEQEKGIVLLEQLQKNKKDQNDLLPKELQDTKRELEADLQFTLNRIKKLEVKLLNAVDDTQKKIIQSKILNLQAAEVATTEQYHQLQQQLEVDYLNEKIPKITSQTITTIQTQLEIGQTLISYYICSEYKTGFGWVLTKDNYELVLLSQDDFEIDHLVKQLLKSINQFRYAKYIKTAYQLYEQLLVPILPHLEANKTNDLIIIPHGSLSQLPFESLLTADVSASPSNGYAELPYLIHQYNISYHLSASLFHYTKTNQKNKTHLEESFVGFAPVYLDQQSTNTTNDKQQDFVSPQVLEAVGIASRSLRIGEQNYEALIYSEEEVKNVQALFEDEAEEVTVYLHEQATKDNFEQVVQDKKYIHIAAHGFETKTTTDLAGIVFSPQETDQEQDDAILYLQDMSQLQLTADLVVLSSCKSGIGKLKGGEGMMAMNRGFLAAGANNVIYTLFKIYDQSSSELIKYFFEQVIQHQKRYSDALRIAKQQLIKQKQYSPKHWAGFVLIGQ